MSIKRFVQLFVLYFLSIVIAVPLTKLLKVDNVLLSYFIISVIGYVTLTLPLTIMTIKKERKKIKGSVFIPEYADNFKATGMINALIEQLNQLEKEYPNQQVIILDEHQHRVTDIKKINSDFIQLTLDEVMPTIRFIHANQFNLTIKVT